MKSTCAGLVVMTLAVLIGCEQGTPGGPGTNGRNPIFGQTTNTFNLSVPILSSSLHQGGQLESTVGIDRATNFDRDVALKFTDVPQGVTVEPANPTIKHGETEVKLTFKAEGAAPPGDYKVKISGHPTSGVDAQIEFKLAVVKG